MARVKSFVKINHKDPVVNRIQEHIEQAFQPITKAEIIDGAFLQSVELTTGSDNIVEHKLGRQVIGYIVVSKSANSVIFDKINDATDTTDKKLFLNLQCSANATVNLWVF